MEWQPISEASLWDEIISAEARMSPDVFRFWDAIKISPEKWSEKRYGSVGGGFWVVAVLGSRVLWFNDIEDGFNWSSYLVWGRLAEYFCDQDELEMAVRKGLNLFD